jgi:hypothetical protein
VLEDSEMKWRSESEPFECGREEHRILADREAEPCRERRVGRDKEKRPRRGAKYELYICIAGRWAPWWRRAYGQVPGAGVVAVFVAIKLCPEALSACIQKVLPVPVPVGVTITG